ncbi:TIGR02678 family protein [Alkalicoccus urumqiensis]|uniref:TIGR02678 family protein n=1 Tax=Alkalicoccus urumqiensis TaxID=1548213 RepID=A0A2P6MJS3_ALKUR|nr:TIGR02678 family protein [Alkalicoccus urumqiensis]PRO66505.1 TIGR02678 family protein [Alkalicoccus urumqiensis]
MFDEKAVDALDILLHQFWVLRSREPKAYQLIREREKVLRRYIEDKFGLHLLVHPHVIKLEKIPVEPKAWMGLAGFQEKRDYVLFCSAMAFLEEKAVEEQFLLSELTEEIRQMEEDVDWTVYTHRKSLIRALKALTDLELIRLVDGHLQPFDMDQEQEVLYETTVYGSYFLRAFPAPLSSFSGVDAVQQAEQDMQRDHERRRRVYRKLFFTPAVQREGADDADFLYIRTHRSWLMEDIESHSPFRLRVFKNTALLTVDHPKPSQTVFPDTKAVSDVLLQLASVLHEERGTLEVFETGEVLLTHGEFEALLEKTRRRFGSGWAKYLRESSVQAVKKECLEAMKAWEMAVESHDQAMIYVQPAAGILAGTYPDDYEDGEADS